MTEKKSSRFEFLLVSCKRGPYSSLFLTVPNASPNLKPVGYNMSSTSLNISWQTIPRADINGILRGYILFYKPSSSNEGARNITVPADYLSVHVTGLRKYTAYELRVAGVTSKGTGAMSARSLVYTDEDGTILKPQLNEDES